MPVTHHSNTYILIRKKIVHFRTIPVLMSKNRVAKGTGMGSLKMANIFISPGARIGFTLVTE